MKNRIVIVLSILLAVLIFSTYCFAQMIDYERKKIRARGGSARASASKKDSSKEDEDLPEWMISLPEARNRHERRFDVNRDGKLQIAEVKVYLRRALKVVEKKGGFTINSDILKEYDKNGDGVISRIESPPIEEHLNR